MDKTVAGLLAVASVLAVPAQAATVLPSDPAAALRTSSDADLLTPIPNASALLKAAAEARIAEPDARPPLMEVRYWHHHHHHHHRWYRRRWHHHHHHHHHDV